MSARVPILSGPVVAAEPRTTPARVKSPRGAAQRQTIAPADASPRRTARDFKGELDALSAPNATGTMPDEVPKTTSENAPLVLSFALLVPTLSSTAPFARATPSTESLEAPTASEPRGMPATEPGDATSRGATPPTLAEPPLPHDDTPHSTNAKPPPARESASHGSVALATPANPGPAAPTTPVGTKAPEASDALPAVAPTPSQALADSRLLPVIGKRSSKSDPQPPVGALSEDDRTVAALTDQEAGDDLQASQGLPRSKVEPAAQPATPELTAPPSPVPPPATAHLAQPPAGAVAAPSPVAPSNADSSAATSAINQLVLHRAAHGQIDVADLGRIDVHARMRDGEVDVRVAAERASTASLLVSRVPEIASDVRAANIPVGRLDVDAGASGSAHSQHQERAPADGGSREVATEADPVEAPAAARSRVRILL